MPTRRDFVKLATLVSIAGGARSLSSAAAPSSAPPAVPNAIPASVDDRAYWISVARRLAEPMLPLLADRRLKREMPVEAQAGVADRPDYTHLEALGRLLAGLSPWLELGPDHTAEGKERGRLAELACAGIDAATDPASPDFMNFSRGGQPLVDAAFLAQALLRAPTQLWARLDARVQANVIAALTATRVIKPPETNWLLFATMVEVFLQQAGAKPDERRLATGLERHRDWYVGDGTYGDGPEYHWDYYNSFVIQPMLVESLDRVAGQSPEWAAFREQAWHRLTRWAAVQERLIAPDGTYPVVGRSIAYRCGAFQGLALAALRQRLPAEVQAGQARVALTRVIRRTLEAPDTFDSAGWLRIGLSGHQPALGERYISTGSLYLCSVALLPLGLPVTAPFWSAPAAKTTWEKAWSGENIPVDHALSERH